MFDLLKVLPKAFAAWKAVMACIEGGATKDEIRTAVNEIRSLLETIPPLRGVLAMFDVVIKLVDKVIPDLLDNPDVMKDLDIDPDTVQQAANVSTLYKEVMVAATASKELKSEMKLGDVDGMV